MKKVFLLLGLMVICSASYAKSVPEYDADFVLKTFCPSSGSRIMDYYPVCFEAHNAKLQYQTLQELKELRKEIKDLNFNLEKLILKQGI